MIETERIMDNRPLYALSDSHHDSDVLTSTFHLRFKGDTPNEIITMKLNKVIRRTFPAAQLKISYATHPILPQQVKDKLPSSTTAMCVYKFDCSCGASYLGRTTRLLSACIKEHHPAWLIKGRTGNIRSAIVQHLVDIYLLH